MKASGDTAMSKTAKILGVMELTFYWLEQDGENYRYMSNVFSSAWTKLKSTMFQLILGTYIWKTRYSEIYKFATGISTIIFSLGTINFNDLVN